MLLQSDKTVPPPGARPDFRALAEEAKARAVNNQWFLVPSSKITVGMNDPENNNPPTRFFGWDNEKPQRSVQVPAFRAKGRAITNAEYAKYLEVTGKPGYPASWTKTSSGISVRTVYGPVPLKDALHWPVMASYDELSACAKSMGGRIPTYEEVMSIYSYADRLNSKNKKGLLVQESSLSGASTSQSPNRQNPRALFANLEGCNVGFQHFHPMPITQNGKKLSGRAEMGGVWEWTSSVLENYKEFVPSELYPGYTGTSCSPCMI
jgi:formylglycine-generating enzyme required for sulfatase activity